jgi:hypothetical protein
MLAHPQSSSHRFAGGSKPSASPADEGARGREEDRDPGAVTKEPSPRVVAIHDTQRNMTSTVISANAGRHGAASRRAQTMYRYFANRGHAFALGRRAVRDRPSDVGTFDP